jgi:predicted outer membrane protein
VFVQENLTMSFKKLLSSSICTAVLCTAASAQETKSNQGAFPQQVGANQAAGKGMSQAMVTPQQLAACWALDNQEEVILAKFAQEKSKNKEVTSFAKMVVEEHQACLKKLSKFAPEATREGYLVDSQSEQSGTSNDESSSEINSINQTKKTNPNATAGQNPNASGSASPGIDMMQLQREIAQQCISDSKKYLNTKDGDEFDKCFVGMQIAKHAAMHTKLVVLQRHTSDEMQQMVTEGIQSTDKHMKAAGALMKKLDDSEFSTSVTKNDK